MLYPLSYEGLSAALPGRSLAPWLCPRLVRRVWLGRVVQQRRRRQCLMVLTGCERGRDVVIDRVSCPSMQLA
jgi:hypothetical protein